MKFSVLFVYLIVYLKKRKENIDKNRFLKDFFNGLNKFNIEYCIVGKTFSAFNDNFKEHRHDYFRK